MIRPILNRCFSVSHRSPSKPTLMPRGKLIRGRNGHTSVKAKKITPLYPTTADCQGLKAVSGAGFGRFTPAGAKSCDYFAHDGQSRPIPLCGGFPPLEKAPTEEGAGQAKERFVDVGPFLITDTQATKLIQPGESKFHHQRHGPVHCHAQRFVWGAKGRCGGQISVTFGRASSSLVASRLCLVAVCSPLPGAP